MPELSKEQLEAFEAAARDLERRSTLKGAMMAEALLDEVTKERDALRTRLAEVMAAGGELAQWANRMPDAGITTDDPRLWWWYERPIARWQELTDQAPTGEDVRGLTTME